MGNNKIYLDPESVKQLNVNFAKFSSQVNAQCKKELQGIGMQIIGDAKQTLKENDNRATGVLMASGSVKPQMDGTFDVGFYANYASAIEFGRKRGRPPSVESIYQWIKKKGIADEAPPTKGKRNRGKNFEQRARELAFVIARSIGKKGTKAKPFLMPAFQKWSNRVERIISQAVNNIINSTNNG